MSATKIQWCDETINPVRGCECLPPVERSPGCINCFAEKLASTRLSEHRAYQGLTDERGRWTGNVSVDHDAMTKVLRRQTPTRYFCCDMGDLFHAPARAILETFRRMADAEWHTFVLLTKRAERMREIVNQMRCCTTGTRVVQVDVRNRQIGQPHQEHAVYLSASGDDPVGAPRNVWVGVSAEDQARTNERMPLLLDAKVATRIVCCEPLLRPVDLNAGAHNGLEGIGWVIAGCEKIGQQPGRPAELDWFRWLRDQCVESRVPFFLKQAVIGGRVVGTPELDGRQWTQVPGEGEFSKEHKR